MTASLDMIRGRSNVVTLTNNSGGALIAGDVCIQDTSGDEYVTTTTSAASTLKIFVAVESIAGGASGKFYESGYCPFVNVSASATRGRFLFTHTVAKQAAENATFGAGAFGKILKSGTTPSAIIYSATAQVGSSGVTRSGSTTDAHLAVWNGSNADSIKDGGAVPTGGGDPFGFGTLTPPVLTNFTAETNNSTYYIASDTNGVVHWKCMVESGDKFRGYYRAYPATPKVTMACYQQFWDGGFNNAGIYISDGTKYKVFGISGLETPYCIYFDTWNHYASDAVITNYRSHHAPLIWMQYEEDATDRFWRLSSDGYYWTCYLKEAKTTSLTGTRIGFGSYCALAPTSITTDPAGIGAIVHWAES